MDPRIAPGGRHPGLQYEEYGVAKYDELGEHLLHQSGKTITLPFDRIEEIIGAALPISAFAHVAWWANDPNRVQAASWLAAGWMVESVDLDCRTATFARTE
jgi:hypothetical protein